MSHYTYTIENGKRKAQINTAHGLVRLPTFIPVTTFGDKYPLDKLVQPYLKRMSQCLMVSHFYAQQMKKRPSMPVFIDSGGFASLFAGSEIVEHEGFASIKTKDGDEIDPLQVLEFQERMADIGATLDFIIPPGLDQVEAERRLALTIQNALFMKAHTKSESLMLFGSLQCWDVKSARRCAQVYANGGFEGIAIGGMVPHAKEPEYIKDVVRAVREEAPDCAIHVFGCGNAALIPELIHLGVDSFDASSYARSSVGARKEGDRQSVGIHTSLYAALEQLAELNTIVQGEPGLSDQIPNARLCMR